MIEIYIGHKAHANVCSLDSSDTLKIVLSLSVFGLQEIFSGVIKGCKSHNLLIYTLMCGERGIRTPGASQHDGFQDRCNRPLYHLSNGDYHFAT